MSGQKPEQQVDPIAAELGNPKIADNVSHYDVDVAAALSASDPKRAVKYLRTVASVNRPSVVARAFGKLPNKTHRAKSGAVEAGARLPMGGRPYSSSREQASRQNGMGR